MASVGPYLLLLLPVMAMAIASKTYIVHMKHHEKPSIYPTHHDWYSATLSAYTPSHSLLYAYTTAYNGFAASLDPQQVEALRRSHSVLGVYEDTVYTLHTTRTPQFLGLETQSGLWEGHNTQELHRASRDVIIGVLDTGVWPESRSFHDSGMPDIPIRWRGECESSVDFSPWLCNKKLIGARSFSRGYHMGMPNHKEAESPRDRDGHGTHTATTAAGSHVPNASMHGYASGTASGMAPQARLAAYKVCWNTGCFGSDILAAMDRAIQDGVDVLSLSLGGASAPYYHDIIAVGAFAAMERGIFVSCSAGNSGPTTASLANVDLMKPSLELRSHSKRKISNIWSFFLYIIWRLTLCWATKNASLGFHCTVVKGWVRVRVREAWVWFTAKDGTRRAACACRVHLTRGWYVERW